MQCPFVRSLSRPVHRDVQRLQAMETMRWERQQLDAVLAAEAHCLQRHMAGVVIQQKQDRVSLALGFVWAAMCGRTCGTKISAVIHPVAELRLTAPGGDPDLSRAGGIRFWGNSRTGGMLFPSSAMHPTTFTIVPRSAEAICPTCFRPVGDRTFVHMAPLVMPVSSKFTIRPGRT